MSVNLTQLKKNWFYSIMVAMIITLPLTMMYSYMVDPRICDEQDYEGDRELCHTNTTKFQQYGWVLFMFPIGMGIASGLFHDFPETKTETKSEVKKETPKGAIKWVVPFVMSGIGIMLAVIIGDAMSDEVYEQYQYVINAIPVVIFFLAFKWFNKHWFWEDEVENDNV